ncbi:Tetratricopeptide repeat protein 39B [Chelonia mydas]|uniref:Tetratricopeptide repeat protein 39B n=1 Tax=Chelonia mydas TaxID=8469 RepID=M7BEQ7_CHEMY|nr:Tetratricopeptide repeat protein 39B [Chelonia mydas]
MDLKCALEECSMALNLFLNNKFSEALELLRQWSKDSMYHALGYSTILVMQAAMTFEPQDIQMGISTMKEALHTCQRECHQVLQMTQGNKKKNETYHQFEGGVKLGIGAFNLNLGLHQLREGASGTSLRAILCTFTLLVYHTYVSLILGIGEANLQEAEILLEPYLQKFPNGSIILFYDARIDILKGNFEKAIYVFQKAAILCMLPDEDVKTTGEDIVSLFRQVDGLRQRIAGKSIPTEKLAVRKARRYTGAQPVKLILPALEMMYVWNGFAIVGRRADLTESLLITIEKEETALQNQTSRTEYFIDDLCLLQLLKGLCLKHLGRLLQAELCFNQVIQSEKQIKYDNYLVPFTLYELGLLYKQQDQREKAIRYIETAKNNYKEYSMESRLHFRIHAALDSLKVTPASTP